LEVVQLPVELLQVETLKQNSIHNLARFDRARLLRFKIMKTCQKRYGKASMDFAILLAITCMASVWLWQKLADRETGFLPDIHIVARVIAGWPL
jgi:hypothetical protein